MSDIKDSVLIHIKFERSTLFIVFSGLGDEFEFRKTLQELEVNVIYIRDLSHRWYLGGIPGVGNTVDDVVKFLKERVIAARPSKVITMGVSAGGFAALLYGSLLNVDEVTAFSPQTFMDVLRRTMYYDHRWKDRRKQIYESDKSNRKYLDVKPLVKSFRGVINLFYDKRHRLDWLHGRRLRGENIHHFTDGGGGHNLVKELKRSGKLAEHIRSLIKVG